MMRTDADFHAPNPFSQEAGKGVGFGVGNIIDFQLSGRLGKSHSPGPGKKRHFDELSLLPKESLAPRAELIQDSVQQARRGGNGAE